MRLTVSDIQGMLRLQVAPVELNPKRHDRARQRLKAEEREKMLDTGEIDSEEERELRNLRRRSPSYDGKRNFLHGRSERSASPDRREARKRTRDSEAVGSASPDRRRARKQTRNSEEMDSEEERTLRNQRRRSPSYGGKRRRDRSASSDRRC